MLQRLKRNRGGQRGNKNALKHGRYSPRVRAEPRAEWQARWREKQLADAAWAARCPQIDYDSIIQNLIRLRAEQEAEERAHGHHLK